jgi:hypothetical protein
MAFGNGPRIVTNGLVLSLDAGDRNSLSDEPAINLIGNNPIPVSTSGFSFDGPASFTMSYNATEQAIEFESDNTAVWGWYVWNNSLNALPLSTSSLYSTSFEWKVGSRNTYTSSLRHEIIKGDGTTGSFSNIFINNPSSQTGSYARVSSTFTPSSAGVNGDRQYRIVGQPFASGSSRIHLFWRKLQLEQNDHSTTFVSGSRNTWVDLSGNNNNGTLLNNPIYNSGSRGGIAFLNASTYTSTNITAPSPSSTATTYEIAFIPATGSIIGSTGLIGWSNYLADGFSLGISNSNVFGQGYNGASTFFEFVAPVSYSTVNIFTAVYENRKNTYYKNGSLVNSTTYAFDVIPSSTTIKVGGNTQGGWPQSQCTVFYARMYNRALSAVEVLQNYNAQKSRFNL